MYEFHPYFTNDGSVGLYSTDFNDIYHSATGALTEAYEKFIYPVDFNNLLQKDKIKVLDICYGIGYNSKSFLNFIFENYCRENFTKKYSLTKHYIDKIHTNNILQVLLDNFIYKNNICNEQIYTNNIFDKISITAIDNDKILSYISPFIKTGVKNFKNVNINFKYNAIDKFINNKDKISHPKINELINYLIFEKIRLYAYENQRVALDNVKKYQMFYNQAKAFYKSGMNPKVDVTIAETNLSNAKLKQIQANSAVSLAIAKLNNIMGVPYIEKYSVIDKLEYKPVLLSFEELIDVARDSRPELKLAELKVEQANQTVKLSKKSFYPTISFETQYQKGGKSWWSNDGYNIGGYLIFPTINLMLISSEIKEAKYLYDKELANAKNTQNTIYLEIQNAYLKLEELRNQIPYTIIQVKQAKENYELSFGRYKVGEGSPTELKDAENTYEQAQLAYYNALYRYNSAVAELEKSVGKNLNQEQDCLKFKD